MGSVIVGIILIESIVESIVVVKSVVEGLVNNLCLFFCPDFDKLKKSLLDICFFLQEIDFLASPYETEKEREREKKWNSRKTIFKESPALLQTHNSLGHFSWMLEG